VRFFTSGQSWYSDGVTQTPPDQPSVHRGFALNLLPHLLGWQDEEGAIVFDGEGRLYSLYVREDFYRRGLDSSVLCTRRAPSGNRLIRSHRKLEQPEALDLFSQASRWSGRLKARIERRDPALRLRCPADQLLARLDEILRYTPERLLAERERFRRIYDPVSVLPPDQYMALVVQLTRGCPYNDCSFCDLYRDRSFEVKSPTQLREWLGAMREFFGRSLPMRKGVFLGDGNCLCLPISRLAPLIETVTEGLRGSPVLAKGLFSFADIRAVNHKSEKDLRELGELGIRRIYLGLETGAEELLAFLNKPGSRREQLDAAGRLKAAGFQVGVIFMAGIGGRRYESRHIGETLELACRLPLGEGDLIYLSRFYPIPGTPYADAALEGRIDLLSDAQIRGQTDKLRSGILAGRKDRVKVAPYDLAGFVY
jgi:radical SAM superfamily enzyme YgiQ (UPF0313 family)